MLQPSLTPLNNFFKLELVYIAIYF